MSVFAAFGTGQWNEADTQAKKPDAEELKKFYQEQQAQDLERQLSRTKSQQNKPAGARSFFTRRGSRKVGVTEPSAPIPLRSTLSRKFSKTEERVQSSVISEVKSSKTDPESTVSEKSDYKFSGPLSTSIIPDTLAEDHVPAWLLKDSDATSQVNLFRLRHPINNPVGPLWYQNVHLLPPSYLQPQSRPPSFFSPSFPPMAVRRESSHEPIHHPYIPRQSPAASPSSSPVGIVETGKRSRKTSQTAQDQVDFLDASDPTGAQWHHESPYDSGTHSSSSLPESSRPPLSQSSPSTISAPRSRRASFTLPRKTAPSPLSQSTSAVQLPVSDPTPASLPRRPIKVRSALIGGFSIGSSSSMTSAPVNNREAVETTLSDPDPGQDRPSLSLANSDNNVIARPLSSEPASLPLQTMPFTGKKEKRGSVLGRFARRLSTMKKPASPSYEIRGRTESPMISPRVSEQTRELVPTVSTGNSAPSPAANTPEDEMKHLVMGVLPLMSIGPSTANEADNSIELDEPITLGKLHIANPDETTLPSPVIPFAPYRSSTGTVSTDTTVQAATMLVSSQLAWPCSEIAPSLASPVESDISTPRGSKHVDPDNRIVTPTVHDEKDVPPIPPASRSRSPPPSPAPSSTAATTGRATVASVSTDFASPASLSSILVNPPTPLTEPEAMAPLVPQKPTSPTKFSERKPVLPEKERLPKKTTTTSKTAAEAPLRPPAVRAGSSGSVKTRQADSNRYVETTVHTETFKLVKHPSRDRGTGSKGTFPAGGEQWKVVGTVEASRDYQGPRSSRSRDGRTSSERRASLEKRSSRDRRASPDKKASSNRVSPEKRSSRQDIRSSSREGRSSREHSDRRREEKVDRKEEPSSSRREMYSARRRDAQSSSDSLHESARQERRSWVTSRPSTYSSTSRSADVHRSQPLQNQSSRSNAEHSRHKVNLEKPQPAPPPPIPRHPVAGYDKKLATSARPTSEMSSAADLSAMRAREAWDLDRLYKGRSMHNDLNKDQHVSATYPTMYPVPFPVVNAPVYTNEYPITGHGSSHTNFTVQTPFPLQANTNSYYSNMPVAPPPIVYTSTYRDIAPHLANHVVSHAETSTAPAVSRPPGNASPIFVNEPSNTQNPLPLPPRASTYKPATDLPPNDPDFWNKLTAAH